MSNVRAPKAAGGNPGREVRPTAQTYGESNVTPLHTDAEVKGPKPGLADTRAMDMPSSAGVMREIDTRPYTVLDDLQQHTKPGLRETRGLDRIEAARRLGVAVPSHTPGEPVSAVDVEDAV